MSKPIKSLLTLNNYDYSDKFLKQLYKYLETGNVPYFEEKRMETRFLRRYSKNYIINGRNITYSPLNLELVPESKKIKRMDKLYKNFQIGTGTAIRSFYNKVISFYLGIKRTDVQEFIKNQTTYQLNKKEPKKVNKPIVARYPNERWSADLIDVDSYKGYNRGKCFILTVIDNFSKYVFALGLPNKNARTVLNAFEDIVQNQAEGTYPQVLQTDNGGEFVNELLENWARQHNIHLARSMSYQPTSNALIENFNNILRKMMREGFIRTNSLNWIDYLDDYLYNRNHSKHSTTKHQPIDVWRSGKDTVRNNDTEALRETAKAIKVKAKKELDKNQTLEFLVGDKVRVLNSSLYSEVRKLIKSGDKKYIVSKYSPEIFTVDRIIDPRGRDSEFVKTRYTLRDQKNKIQLQEFKNNKPNLVLKPKLFFATELQLIDEKKVSEPVITQAQANKLNRIKVDYNFEKEEEEEEEEEEEKIGKVSKSKRTRAQPEPITHQTRSRTRQTLPPPPPTHRYPTRSKG